MCIKLSINNDRISLNKDKSSICLIYFCIIKFWKYEYAKLIINSNYFIVILN